MNWSPLSGGGGGGGVMTMSWTSDELVTGVWVVVADDVLRVSGELPNHDDDHDSGYVTTLASYRPASLCMTRTTSTS